MRRLPSSSGSSTSIRFFESLERRAGELGLFGLEAGPGSGVTLRAAIRLIRVGCPP